MKKQNLFGKMVKKRGAKAADQQPVTSIIAFYCYQPKEPKGLDKFNK